MNRNLFSGMALMLFSLSVFAGTGDESRMRYKQLDTDKNGYLSFEESNGKHRISYYYSKADKNSDGQIDEKEFIEFEKEVPDWENRYK